MAFPQETPQGITYQAVAYDSEGFEISNQDISVRLGILLGGVDAEASYTEVHSVTTYKLLDFSELGEGIHILSLNIETERLSEMFCSINLYKDKI